MFPRGSPPPSEHVFQVSWGRLGSSALGTEPPRDLICSHSARFRAGHGRLRSTMSEQDGLRDGGFRVPRIIASELAHALEEQIIFGLLEPGARLIEEEIVARYKVSRSPVREAFRALESDGLAIRLPRRGMRVSHLSVDDLDDLYVCRIPLETQAAETASRNHTAEQLTMIEDCMQKLQQAAGDPRLYFQASKRFWNVVHEASGSRTLQRLLTSVAKHAYRYRYRSYLLKPDVMHVSLGGTLGISAAIARRDGDAARRLTAELMVRLLDAQRRVMIEYPPG
jgi:DNA-binding GntR family transcriptional regulator